MKNQFFYAALLIFSSIALNSCDSEDDNSQPDVPTQVEFRALRENALQNITQNFEVEANSGFVILTSQKGVVIRINTDCLELNSTAVTGTVDIEFIEIFDKATMALTHKTPMGRMLNGDLQVLDSDGEFYLNAKKDGQQLQLTCNYSLLIPTTITGGFDAEMTLWDGSLDTAGNLIFDEVPADNNQENGLFQEGNNYYLLFGQFGWCNIDRFHNDARPKTTILVDVPTGYDNQNSAVYVSFDEEGTSLANLDTFTEQGYFSEHYGQIPIGLQCHIIFVTEEDGMYRYAIKPVVIAADQITTFTFSETVTGTEAQLAAAITATQN